MTKPKILQKTEKKGLKSSLRKTTSSAKRLEALPAKAKSKVDYDNVLKLLKKKYPDAHCALNFTNAFELLIATILSAQCTDERVNIVTNELFRHFKTPSDLAKASIDDIEFYIRSTGFYKNKAKNIKACCEILANQYKNQVPQTLEQLYELPGVGRKTANCVLGNAFGIATGVVVDTHVTRLSLRWGWVKTEDAVKIEAELNKRFDSKEWIMLSHYMISHGRAVCKARSPSCQTCFLLSSCPRKGV